MTLVYHGTPSQIVALIAETTPGAGGTPTTRLGATKMDYFSPDAKGTPITPSGNLVPTGRLHGPEKSVAPLAGQMSYGDLPYLYGSALCTAVSGTSAPKASGGDPFDTYSIVTGDLNNTTGGYGYAYAFVDDLGLLFDRDKTSVSGQMIAGLEVPGATLGTLAEVPVVGVQPHDLGLYTSATFGGTYARVRGGFTAEVKTGPRRNPVFTLDDSIASFTALTEKLLEGAAMLQLAVVADTAGADYAVAPFTLANWRQGSRIFVQIKAAPSGHHLTLTCCAIIDTLKKKEFQGTLALDVSAHLADDGSGNWLSLSAA